MLFFYFISSDFLQRFSVLNKVKLVFCGFIVLLYLNYEHKSLSIYYILLNYLKFGGISFANAVYFTKENLYGFLNVRTS